MNIYVSNLSFAVQREDLHKKFSAYGEISLINLVIDGITKRNRGFAFIGMRSKAAAENAIRELNGSMLDGRSIKVKEAQSQTNNDRTFY